MKSILYLLTVSVLPVLNGTLCRAQDSPAGLPKPDTTTSEEPPAKAAVHARQEFGRASQNFDEVFGERLQNVIRRAPGPGTRPLIIRSSTMDAKDQANLEEDLAVMARVLEKQVQEPMDPSHPYSAMGIDVFGAATPMRDLYLDGYGAVFMLRVGIPLVPAPDNAEPKSEGTEGDSAWAQAREELYGQGPGGGSFGPPNMPFSEDKVNDLKMRLFEALKSATNIRQLKPDDSITVCVFGGRSAGLVKFRGRSGAGTPNGPIEGRPGAAFFVNDRGGQRSTIMTIRVKKADVDAWAKGKIEGEQFRKHARIETYAGAASGGENMVFGTGGGGFGGGTGY